MNKIRKICRTATGQAPFEEWLDNLRDILGRAKIRVRVDRAAQGNFGDHRTVGGGIIELKTDFGPGYLVYLGRYGEEIIVLLCGGDKSTQQKDIAQAHKYWEDYKKRI